jgi:hypothetical protein
MIDPRDIAALKIFLHRCEITEYTSKQEDRMFKVLLRDLMSVDLMSVDLMSGEIKYSMVAFLYSVKPKLYKLCDVNDRKRLDEIIGNLSQAEGLNHE